MSDHLLDTKEKPQPRIPFAAPYVLALSVIDGPDFEVIHRITASPTVIGRDEACEFRLDDPQVSKQHVQIEVTSTVYTLIDLGSRNGTLVNDQPVKSEQRHRLKHMDEIQIGDTRLLFTANRVRDRK